MRPSPDNIHPLIEAIESCVYWNEGGNVFYIYQIPTLILLWSTDHRCFTQNKEQSQFTQQFISCVDFQDIPFLSFISSPDFSIFYPHHFQPPGALGLAPRSAMDGKLLIANPNCTTAIAAMALWPSGHPDGTPGRPIRRIRRLGRPGRSPYIAGIFSPTKWRFFHGHIMFLNGNIMKSIRDDFDGLKTQN